MQDEIIGKVKRAFSFSILNGEFSTILVKLKKIQNGKPAFHFLGFKKMEIGFHFHWENYFSGNEWKNLRILTSRIIHQKKGEHLVLGQFLADYITFLLFV
uniref:Uncharacterized protein n=1 Tax=Cacopsylla melanoneura TaxID=428564 RepID=A0A8D9E7T6_9HEMI